MSKSKKVALADAKSARESGIFFPLPLCVLQSPEFVLLSAYGVKLLIDLLSQWRLNNNGYLSPSWALMQARGWKSKATLAKALKELESADWIIRTRQGGRNRASLYAVSFQRIDDHHRGKPLDVAATRSPPSYWRKTMPPLIKIANPTPPSGAIDERLPQQVGQKLAA
ncbi:hypothetical protein HZU75_16280 [Chitinibacter fontanus]|uniref:Helix-turn-helix domain-containing protein n=1 Tax=Chitinibacter fontanus TaxID=1737446 RepID=A0A7D5VBJ7_9NEIS|nr:hypothetical protein [Chitinibacter fontanus]QLI82951.1 hypothetical protein HZU75_16280 [Chitinibacter fontanus]